MKTADRPPIVRVFDAAFRSDPLAAYREALARSWYAPFEAGILVLGNEAIYDLSRDRRLRHPGVAWLDRLGITDGPLRLWWTNMLLNLEGAQHSRLRKLLSPAFRPGRIDAMRLSIREEFARLLDGVRNRQELEFVEEVSGPFPVSVLCRSLGVPVADAPSFAGWVDTMAAVGDMNQTDEELRAIESAVQEFWDYTSALVTARRGDEPRDDLLQQLLDARDGDDCLTDQEIIGTVMTLLFAGQDTTKHQFSNLVLLLAELPGYWQELSTMPRDVLPGVVEEVLRLDPVIGSNPRIAAEDLEYRDVHLAAGTFLQLIPLAGGHDPAAFEAPETFDPARRGEGHVAFGAGPHFCIGAHLARAEMVEALGLLLDHWVSVEVVGEVRRRSPLGIAGVSHLPVRATWR